MSKNLLHCSGLPSCTQTALRCAGYETVGDLVNASADSLSKELGISIADAQGLICATQSRKAVPMSQSAASLARADVFKCKWSPVNKVLGGGLPRSHVLEISGPPGSFKESLACDFVRVFIEVNEEVVFVDMQNMTSPHVISGLLESTALAKTLVYYRRVHTLPDLLIFLHNLSLDVRPKTGLVVLNSLPFVFQSHPSLLPSKKNVILGSIRQSLLELCVTKNLTVIITSQMATKILHGDGSPATFDSGTKAIMAPQLGTNYLPSGRSFRLIIAPQSRASGVIRMVSSPASQQRQDASSEEHYVLVITNEHSILVHDG